MYENRFRPKQSNNKYNSVRRNKLNVTRNQANGYEDNKLSMSLKEHKQ